MAITFDLMVAPNGARLMPSDHASIPITVSDIMDTAVACEQAGATSIHVHVRDSQGRHSLDQSLYAEATEGIQSRTSLQIQISTEAAGVFDVSAQQECLEQVMTRDASVSLRELERESDRMGAIYKTAYDRGIDVQHILYSADEVTRLLTYYEDGQIPEGSRRAIFVLGRYNSDQQSASTDLLPFLDAMGSGALTWSVCAFGQAEQDCLMAALDNGGNARIGFENNRLAPDGSVFPNNAASVASFVERAAAAGFRPERRP